MKTNWSQRLWDLITWYSRQRLLNDPPLQQPEWIRIAWLRHFSHITDRWYGL